jgi:glutathione S-transferase
MIKLQLAVAPRVSGGAKSLTCSGGISPVAAAFRDMRPVARHELGSRVVGFDYEHDTRSVFADFDALRQINPIGRISSLVLAGGEVLIDSVSILDWLDQTVGPERALVPPGGAERRRALRLIALATGAIDKAGAAAYERIIRPSAFRWPEWINRCMTQATSAISALAAEPWPAAAYLDQAQTTTACMIRYVRMADPALLPPGRHPALDALSDRCEARPEFQATYPNAYALPRGDVG